MGDVESAKLTYEQMLVRRQMGSMPHVALAKIYEHKLKDFARALAHTRAAIQDCAPEEICALKKREVRLILKLENAKRPRKE